MRSCLSNSACSSCEETFTEFSSPIWLNSNASFTLLSDIFFISFLSLSLNLTLEWSFSFCSFIFSCTNVCSTAFISFSTIRFGRSNLYCLSSWSKIFFLINWVVTLSYSLDICFSIIDFKSAKSFAPIFFAKLSSIFCAIGFCIFTILHLNKASLPASSFFG